MQEENKDVLKEILEKIEKLMDETDITKNENSDYIRAFYLGRYTGLLDAAIAIDSKYLNVRE